MEMCKTHIKRNAHSFFKGLCKALVLAQSVYLKGA